MKRECKKMRIHMARLIQIQLLQLRKNFWCIAIAAFVVPLWSTYWTYIELSKAEPGRILSRTGYQLGLFIMLGLILGATYNILSKNEIRTFPGTVLCRYGSSVIVAHIMIITSAAASVCSYFLQGGLALLLDRFGKVGISGSLFDISYLWHGAVRYLAAIMALYGVLLLWFVLLARFRPGLVYLIAIVLFAGNVASTVESGENEFMFDLINLLQGNGYPFGVQIAVLFEIWAVCLFLATLLARGVRTWAPADGKRLAVTVGLGYFAMMAFMWTPAFYEWPEEDTFSYEMDLKNFQRDSLHQAEVVVDISDWEEQDPDLLSMCHMALQSGGRELSYSTLFAGVSCSADEAEKAGLSFDASQIDQDHVILLLGTNRNFYSETDPCRDFLKSISATAKLVKSEWDKKEDGGEESDLYYYQMEVDRMQCVLMNEFYGDICLDREDFQRKRWGFQCVTDSLLGVVIY